MSQVQSIEQALKSATAILTEGGKESPSLDAAVLLCHVLGKPRTYLLTWPEKALEAEQQAQFDALLERRIAGEPVAYIIAAPKKQIISPYVFQLVSRKCPYLAGYSGKRVMRSV